MIKLIHTHTHIYTYMCVHTHTYIHIYVCTHTHTHRASPVALVVKNPPANAET